ncbi:OmpA family protein [uncultured Thiocystis sp.]|jgi:outer membrane protein OmpA-like peptidoglycan-associated protein|uniref:OmpA family protein n=1 Tax=uncultured Thiocystis sp. TaxID=1202134 RepID=UPI0025E84814|nr:OmpA family protein [uncultured Thiocystis sp.]
MSDANPSSPAQSAPEQKPESALQQKSRLAVGFLILMFASGLLLVYLVDVTQPMTAGGQEDTHVGIAAPSSAASTVAAEVSVEPSARVPDAESDPQLFQETQAMREQLTETQQKLQTVEDDLKAWKEQQAKALESERQSIVDELAAITQAHQRELAEASAPDRTPDESLAQLKRDYATLNAQFTDDGVLVSLTESDLNFPMGGAALPSERLASLEKVVWFLGRHQNVIVLLQGHTDSLGNAVRNLGLSEQRAIAVKDALVGLGVAQNRIRAEGMGETKPIASNDTAQGRSRNRRVDLYLTER